MTIAARESAAQGPYSTRNYAARSISSSSGIFGSLFGGGVPLSRSRNSRSNSSYARPYQGYGGYGSYRYGAGAGRYRTLCVRTCDGYYWPVSYSTSRANFARDAKQCQSSCEVPARLFVYRNPGADVQNMADLEGKPYAQMEHAFRYRSEYVKDCRCKPDPWSAEAKQDYARRDAGEPMPGQVKTATAEEETTGAPAKPEPVAYTGRKNSRKRLRTARRGRNRSNEVSRYDGQWWAGSW